MRFELLSKVRGLFVFSIVATTLSLSGVSAADSAKDDTTATIDGRTITVAIDSIDDQGRVQFADGTSLNLLDVLSINRSVETVRDPDSKSIVQLAYGGSLSARDVELKNERVSFRPVFGPVELPIESVRAIIFKPAALNDAVRENIAHPSNQFDVVWAESGEGPQAAEGLIQSIADGKLTGEFEGTERTVSQARIIAYIAADLELKPASGLANCQLADGSSLRGTIELLSAGNLSVRFPGGGRAEIPWSTVVSITMESNRLKWLTEVTPVSSEQEPIVTGSHPAQINRSVGGNPLMLRTSQQPSPVVYSNGFGVHAFSRLVFPNDFGFDRLTGVVGIDAETQGNGDCVFIVRGDGIELWSQRVRASDDPQAFDVDVSNVREISLIVEPGAALDLGDHADWCNVRMLKTK